MRILELIEESVDRLHKDNVDDARLKAELLVSEALSLPRLELPLQQGQPVAPAVAETVRAQTERLAEGEPLQYILGTAFFMGLPFKVDPRALIPRPETEILVQAAQERIEAIRLDRPRVADVGTGSGCIALSLRHRFPDAEIIASDVSARALSLARENAELLGADQSIAWREGPLLEPYDPGSLDLVVSNPPYVSDAEMESLPEEILAHEPRQALAGGSDGLAVIRKLIQSAPDALGNKGYLLVEIGAGQPDAVTALMGETGFRSIEVINDLAGRARVVGGEWPS